MMASPSAIARDLKRNIQNLPASAHELGRYLAPNRVMGGNVGEAGAYLANQAKHADYSNPYTTPEQSAHQERFWRGMIPSIIEGTARIPGGVTAGATMGFMRPLADVPAQTVGGTVGEVLGGIKGFGAGPGQLFGWASKPAAAKAMAAMPAHPRVAMALGQLAGTMGASVPLSMLTTMQSGQPLIDTTTRAPVKIPFTDKKIGQLPIGGAYPEFLSSIMMSRAMLGGAKWAGDKWMHLGTGPTNPGFMDPSAKIPINKSGQQVGTLDPTGEDMGPTAQQWWSDQQPIPIKAQGKQVGTVQPDWREALRQAGDGIDPNQMQLPLDQNPQAGFMDMSAKVGGGKYQPAKIPTKTMYHGTGKPSGKAVLGKGTYLAPTPDAAARYGDNVSPFTIKPGTKLVDLTDPGTLDQFTQEAIHKYSDDFMNASKSKGYDSAIGDVVAKHAKDLGYDGVQGDDNIFGTVVFDKGNLAPEKVGGVSDQGGKYQTNPVLSKFKSADDFENAIYGGQLTPAEMESIGIKVHGGTRLMPGSIEFPPDAPDAKTLFNKTTPIEPVSKINPRYKVPQSIADDPGVFWHGSPVGKVGGTGKPAHLGTHEAARQALEARIGIPVKGGWDGTREYGKTKLAGKQTMIQRGDSITGYNVDAPEKDYYPSEMPGFGSTKAQLLPQAKPNIMPYRITGGMKGTPDKPLTDVGVNQLANRGRLGEAGRFYKNMGEDAGSISAVVPDASYLTPVKVDGVSDQGGKYIGDFKQADLEQTLTDLHKTSTGQSKTFDLSTPKSTQKLDPMTQKAIKTYGTTMNPKEAGYITPDGKMLDFSGRHEATGYDHKTHRPLPGQPDYLANQRSLDHRDVGDMTKLMNKGNIRFSDHGENSVQINVGSTPISPAQLKTIKDVAGNKNIIYDIDNQSGTTISSNEGNIHKFVSDMRQLGLMQEGVADQEGVYNIPAGKPIKMGDSLVGGGYLTPDGKIIKVGAGEHEIEAADWLGRPPSLLIPDKYNPKTGYYDAHPSQPTSAKDDIAKQHYIRVRGWSAPYSTPSKELSIDITRGDGKINQQQLLSLEKLVSDGDTGVTVDYKNTQGEVESVKIPANKGAPSKLVDLITSKTQLLTGDGVAEGGEHSVSDTPPSGAKPPTNLPQIRKVDVGERKWVDTRGTTVRGDKDIAPLVQQASDPGRESFHVILVKGDKVVAHNALTSDHISGVNVDNKYLDQIESRMKRTGADKLYLGHNHPTGDVDPSMGDVSFTGKFIHRFKDKFQSHQTVSAAGDRAVVGGSPVKVVVDGSPVNTRGTGDVFTIDHPSKVAELLRANPVPADKEGIVVLDNRFSPIAIKHVALGDRANIPEVVNQAIAESGGAKAVLVDNKGMVIPDGGIPKPIFGAKLVDIVIPGTTPGKIKSLRESGAMGQFLQSASDSPEIPLARPLFGLGGLMAPSLLRRQQQQSQGIPN